jgi:hypothetical protein
MAEDLYPRLGFDIVAAYDDRRCVPVRDLALFVSPNH